MTTTLVTRVALVAALCLLIALGVHHVLDAAFAGLEVGGVR